MTDVSTGTSFGYRNARRLLSRVRGRIAAWGHRRWPIGTYRVVVGRHPARVPAGTIVLFPLRLTLVGCGVVGLVAVKAAAAPGGAADIDALETALDRIAASGIDACLAQGTDVDAGYLCGETAVDALLVAARRLKGEGPFQDIFRNGSAEDRLDAVARRLQALCNTEAAQLADRVGRLETAEVDTISARLESLKDAHWCLRSEVLDNLQRIRHLLGPFSDTAGPAHLGFIHQLNSVLNSIERLEVRGRDSAGISVLCVLEDAVYRRFMAAVDRAGLGDALSDRLAREILVNGSIAVRADAATGRVTVAMVYKVAAEIGSLGDNPRFLREQIRQDAVLHRLLGLPNVSATVLCHTRWASVGAITEANCHPVDNAASGSGPSPEAVIHVCLNGDIDNYIALKAELEASGISGHHEITTDTKLIPLQIEKHLRAGQDVAEAFRLAVNDFEGSHAICMHTDLAPGKLFLAQRGSGQAIFVGLGEDRYMATSEVYGFVEETSRFIKLDGETVVDGPNGPTQGQIVVLDQNTGVSPQQIAACSYDGSPIHLDDEDVKQTEITSRDIDRQAFPHYFLKEISEAPDSVARTLLNRWRVQEDGDPLPVVHLDDTVVPKHVKEAIATDRIRRIFFIGQGTAGVAALACADILNTYLDDPTLPISALKASELSGFRLGEAHPEAMADALVVAISQSGTTTDTNKTVDMVRERGACTLAIVNRRDSDLTFKVDGTLYTSSGRDIEMSVASTKAFYSQIVAGAVLGLSIARLKGRRGDRFIAEEVRQLLALPDHMRQVLAMRDPIEACARRLAVQRTYWAAVGSGPNKAAADEIRIKLSELCYKTISSDYVEDKKHIDLSSEPLILVCAAGARSSVIGDIIKDTAIFRAHKALPVVIADEGERRFDPYAEAVFPVPPVSEHLAPILCTLVGHLWGYYAALAINEGSRFLYRHREGIRQTLAQMAEAGLDLFEVVLEARFREGVARFSNEFRKIKSEKGLPGVMGVDTASDITLLLKYLAGRLPVADFELDFGVKGTARNMLDHLFTRMGEAINSLARPVDAIKHQAKTVTVGTSRIEERLTGILFDALAEYGIATSQLINRNLAVLKHLQAIVAGIKGAILYRIDGLDLLGNVTEATTIEVVQKAGILKPIPSRVETDTRLKGTKRIIVQQGNVYIGKGRKDDRSILVIPAISASPERPNSIDHLLLLNIGFTSDVPLPAKIKALGGKYEHIKNIVQESSIPWSDDYLELPPMEDLFGRSAEKIAEAIASRVNGAAHSAG